MSLWIVKHDDQCFWCVVFIRRIIKPINRLRALDQLGWDMIVCSCNRINHHQIRSAVTKILEADPNVMLTPGIVYRELGYRAECGTCLALAIEHIIDEIDHPTEERCQIIQLSLQRDKLRAKRDSQSNSRKTAPLG